MEVALGDGGASVQGEDCRVTSTAGCEIEIACPSAGDAGSAYVQTLTFALPTGAGQSTGNALAEMGPGYCGFEGSAVARP